MAANNRPTHVKSTGNTYAMQFCSTGTIKEINIYIPRVTTGEKQSLTVSLFTWTENYAKTIKGTPVKESTFDSLPSGEYIRFDAGNAPAGEYVVLLSKGTGAYFAIESNGTANVRTYMNHSVTGGGLMADIKIENGGFGVISDNKMTFVDSSTWVATDGLGRVVPNSYTDTTRENKTVGLFFHTWHTSNAGLTSRNITEILKEHPEIKNDINSPYWGNAGTYHWDQPIWGYYQTNDEWVLRRQAEMLADAGVDVVVFDNTNGTVTFINEVLVLCKVWAQARLDGIKTPQISFMLPMFEYDDVAVQLRQIYKSLYKDGLYQDLWFYWKGKPLMVGYPGRLDPNDETDAEILDFFNYRVINHAQSQDHVQVMNEDGTPAIMGAIQQEVTDKYQLWNWISTYPQLVNRNADGSPEQVAVAIAHNWCEETHLTAMNNPKYQVFGRHYSPKSGKVDPREDAKLYGPYFSEQFDYALEIDPEFIWITGWNEGVAGRFDDFLGVPNAFPDNFSDEYSRDIEPSKGDLKDHYYYLMCQYIRKYKGVSAAKTTDGKTIDINDFSSWSDVTNIYESYANDVFDRNAKGYIDNATGKYYVYTDETGRNDIVSSKATYDENNVYFLVETNDDITPYTDNAWMRLLLDVQEAGGQPVQNSNWESFEYIVNRTTPVSSSAATLEKSTGGWNFETVGEISYNVSGNKLSIAIPRAMLGIDGKEFVLNFKWSDNMQEDGDIMDFYTHGDVAPVGRFKYQLASSAPKSNDNFSDSKVNPVPFIAGGAIAVAACGAAAAVVISKKKKESNN